MKFELTPRNLYILGFACFLIISAMGVWSFIIGIAYGTHSYITATVSLAYLAFNIGMAMLFNYMRKITPLETISEGMPNQDIIDQAIQESMKHDEHLGNEEKAEEHKTAIKRGTRKELA